MRFVSALKWQGAGIIYTIMDSFIYCIASHDELTRKPDNVYSGKKLMKQSIIKYGST